MKKVEISESKSDEFYYTTYIEFASVLSYFGFRIAGHSRKINERGEKRTEFVFEKQHPTQDLEIHDLSYEYSNGELLCDPKALFLHRRDMTALVHQH